MLTIGEYSRLTQVPAKTLRYYDEIDLFKPVQVDRDLPPDYVPGGVRVESE